MNNEALFSSDSNEWYTPSNVLEWVTDAMGEIDLDPCSNSHEAPNVPAKVHYTKEDDGIGKQWNGRVFMNPPYGREVGRWTRKAIEEFEAGRVSEMIVLVANRSDTQWFKKLARGCSGYCTIEGRLNFSNSRNSSTFPSAVFYFGENIKGFDLAFRDHGLIWIQADGAMA